MADKLKDRIERNREEFEIYQTDFDLAWEGIEQRLDSQPGLWTRGLYIMSRVAAVLLIALLAGFLYINVQSTKYSADGISLSQVSPEMEEAELFYSQLIEDRLNVIRSSNVELDLEIENELAGLDSAYSELKRDLKDDIDNEEVINAMIQNYRLKLDLLEQILVEIKRQENDEDADEINI